MKKTLLAVIAILSALPLVSQAQWTTSGSNIYNSNAGNVGIGTTSPSGKLGVVNTLTGAHSTNSTLLHITDAYNAGASGQFFQIIGAGDGTDYTNMNLISNYGYLSLGARADATSTPTNSLNILSSGKVGIGTTDPSSHLHVIGDGASGTNSSVTGSGFSLWRTTSNTGGLQFRMKSSNSGISGLTFPAQIFAEGSNVNVLELYTTGTTPVVFGVNSTESMRIDASGKIGIGTTSPDEKLTVYGKIHSQEVKVDLSVPGPDYVFKKSYKLPSLASVKAYVDLNHHLPEIPTATEMAKNGIDLGDMNTKLLKKVEELTLYLIEKDRQADEQKLINQSLQQQLDNVKQQVKAVSHKHAVKH